MYKTKSVWGGTAGKVLAALLLLAVIFAAVSLTLARSAYGKSLLGKEDIKVAESVDNGDGTLDLSLRINELGRYLSGYKTEKSGDKLVIKLYSSAREGDLKPDKTGAYSLRLKLYDDTGSVVQEGPGGEEHVLVKIKTGS